MGNHVRKRYQQTVDEKWLYRELQKELTEMKRKNAKK